MSVPGCCPSLARTSAQIERERLAEEARAELRSRDPRRLIDVEADRCELLNLHAAGAGPETVPLGERRYPPPPASTLVLIELLQASGAAPPSNSLEALGALWSLRRRYMDLQPWELGEAEDDDDQVEDVEPDPPDPLVALCEWLEDHDRRAPASRIPLVYRPLLIGRAPARSAAIYRDRHYWRVYVNWRERLAAHTLLTGDLR